MASQVTITISGDDELRAKLQRLGSRIANLQEPMSDIGRFMTGFFSGEVFASRGGVIGEPWAPLTDSYAAWKAERFPGRPPLIQRGLMNRSFRARAGRQSVLLYNDDPKFEFHQVGTLRLPARVMMKVDETRRLKARDILSTYLQRAIAS